MAGAAEVEVYKNWMEEVAVVVERIGNTDSTFAEAAEEAAAGAVKHIDLAVQEVVVE